MDDVSPVFEAVSRYFALLSEPMRVRILHAICNEEKSVSDIVAETGATQTNVSRHLNTMYSAGVLNRRKQGTFTYYSVGDEALTAICRTVCIHIAGRGPNAGLGSSDALMVARQFEPHQQAPHQQAPLPSDDAQLIEHESEPTKLSDVESVANGGRS